MHEPDAPLAVIAGARPNFMKVAPIVHRLRQHAAEGREPLMTYRLVHTGQHYDERMSTVFFDELDVRRPDINLGVGSASHAVQTARVMEAFEPVCGAEKPDWVIVVCDVNSTERPVTVTLGSNRLTRLDRLTAEALRHRAGLGEIPPLWDGHAAERIVDGLVAASSCHGWSPNWQEGALRRLKRWAIPRDDLTR